MYRQQATFEGWALVELFGHDFEAGYVTTHYFGYKAIFQIDIPEIPVQQETLTIPRYAGIVIEWATIPSRTRLVNPGAIFTMNPATEQTVRETIIARSEHRPLRVISKPSGYVYNAPEPTSADFRALADVLKKRGKQSDTAN